CKTYLENDFYPFLLSESYDDIENLAVENWNNFLKSKAFRYVRSVGSWSAAMKSEESSIYHAYIQMIDIAKHFMYIEVE
ncbi:unnamed protein product, partial [Rotaria sp. Silwood2]